MPQQADSDQQGIAAGLKNRIQQSAAIAAMRDNEEHPPEKPAYVAPKGDPDNPKTRYGAHPERGEKRIDVSSWMKRLPSQEKTPVYDDGGKVNVNDGKHQVAILKDGERVLTPEQNKDYEKGKGVVGEHSPEERAHFHRALSSISKGGLHRSLGVDESKPLSMEQKEKAAKSENPHIAAQGRLAVAMAHWHHQHGKK